MVNLKSIKKVRKNELIAKLLSIATISVGSWMIFDKIKEWMLEMSFYDKYWWAIALALLWLGLVFFDIE